MSTYRAESNPDLFAQLWLDRDVAVEVIMLEFGYRERGSVYNAAQRLGLPRRKRGSRSDYRTPRQQAATRRASLAAQRKREARECAIVVPVVPLKHAATTWRCRCGGRADTPNGHDRCRVAA